MGNINGAKASIRSPTLTHVMYADDIVLFSKATRHDARTLSNCLEKYCDWSGQSINRAKSGIFFSKHTLVENRRAIKHQFGMKKLKKDAIYLGAPMFPTRSPSRDFKFLEDKSEAKLAGWRSRCLSWAGRATLIKAVAHSIPTYTLSAFNVLANTCNKLDAATKWFWWKPKDRGGKYIAWKSWDKLCHPKKYGGLGFKKTKEMNLALIAKFAWFVASDRQNLCMDVLRSKYKVNSGWLSADPVTAASPTWRAIKEAKKLVAKGGCFLIGEGKPIQVWSNPWVPEIVNFIPQPRLEEYKKFPFKASDLINPISKSWISDWVKELFAPTDARVILNIPIPLSPKQDKLVWLPDSKAACWGLQVDSVNFTLAKEIVSFIMEPPASLIPAHET
nr:putative ribonuclease h protein [Quercus suber]